MKRVRSHITAVGIAAVSVALLGACSSGGSESAVETTPAATDGVPTPETAPPGSVAGGTAPYKLTTAQDGTTTRFDACTGPIRILLNPGDLQAAAAAYTDVDVVAQMGELLTQYAQEIASVTGFEITYAGTTDMALNLNLDEDQVIVFHFGPTGFAGGDPYSDEFSAYGKQKDGWSQIRNYQHFEESVTFSNHYNEAAKLAGGSRDAGIDEAGKRWLKMTLGVALGLQPLIEEDMVAAGIPTQDHGKQIMYNDSHVEQDGVYNLTWGDGDKAGLVAVGADNACFD